MGPLGLYRFRHQEDGLSGRHGALDEASLRSVRKYGAAACRPLSSLAADLENAAGHDEKRAGPNHETHAFERGVEHPSSRAEGENIMRRSDGRIAPAIFC
jgi:hypothetical protein